MVLNVVLSSEIHSADCLFSFFTWRMHLAASFFASSVTLSQYVKQSKHLLCNVQENVNRCTHTHPFTLSICCFYLLQCHIEIGENIFPEANKGHQIVLFSLKIYASKEPKDDTFLKVFSIAELPHFRSLHSHWNGNGKFETKMSDKTIC